jgi:cleavage and polyadenylation specificity factor subunit 1
VTPLHSRLKEYKDTVKLHIFTMDLITRNYPIINEVEGLPYDCFSLIPCSTLLGGVIVLAANSIIYVDQSSRRVVLPVNGWLSRVSDIQVSSFLAEEVSRDLHLEGAHASFVDDTNFFVILSDGIVLPVEIVLDGKVVSKLAMGPPLAQTTLPAIVKKAVGGHFFIGSTSGPSVLIKMSRVEEIVADDDSSMPTAVVDAPDLMDLDDDGTFNYYIMST